MSIHTKLKQKGIVAEKTGKYTCPECSSTRKNKSDKCLSVQFQFDKVLYKCHNCSWSGAVFFNDRPMAQVQKQYNKPVIKNETKKDAVYTYFSKRGICPEIIDNYKIAYNSQKEIIFPYYRNNELINVKYRKNLGDGKKTFRQEANTEKIFFGIDQVTQRDYIIIVEGEVDVLSYNAVGLEAISVPQGASENKLECIENCFDWLNEFETFYIAVDNDEAGKKLEQTLISRLDNIKCKLIKFNQEKDDANTVLLRDAGELLTTFHEAQYLPIAGSTDLMSYKDKIMQFYETGYEKGCSTGWASLDEIFTIKTGYMMIITGIPSRGKSFVADNLLYNLTKENNWKHLICSFENTLENHFARFVSFHTGKKFGKQYIEREEVEQALDYFNNYLFRVELTKMWNIDDLILQLEYMKKRFDIQTFTIDPYNRMDNKTTEREDKYIGSILSKLSMAAKRLDVLIIFIAHPKKPSEKDQVPSMYSISGSSDWYNMADYGVIIHRDRVGDSLVDEVQVKVEKVKDFHIGDPSGGTAYLQYSKTDLRLHDNYKKGIR